MRCNGAKNNGAKLMRHFGEPIETKNVVVRCDGSGGPLGHPAIFLNLNLKEEIVCPYCSRYFVREGRDKLHKKAKKVIS